MTRWKRISQMVAAAVLCGAMFGCAAPPRVSGFSAELDSDTRTPAFGLRMGGAAADGAASTAGLGPRGESAQHATDDQVVKPAELPQLPDCIGPAPVARLQGPDPAGPMADPRVPPAVAEQPGLVPSAPPPATAASAPRQERPLQNAPAESVFNPNLPYWAQQPNLSALPGERLSEPDGGQRLLEPLPTGFGAAPQFFDPKEIFHHDVHDFFPSLCRDVRETANWHNGLLLLAGGGASLAVRETLDDEVSDDTAGHPNRWGRGTDVLGAIGNPAHHLAATAVLYGWSLHTQDDHLHSLSGALFNALVLTDLSTLGLKLVADTGTPNGEDFGWPSGHTASSVAVAAVLDEYYGHGVGLPAYVLAGLVGWARIDDREHELSDVVFGAALGYVIGKSVAGNHHAELFGMQFTPYADYRGTPGIGLEHSF